MSIGTYNFNNIYSGLGMMNCSGSSTTMGIMNMLGTLGNSYYANNFLTNTSDYNNGFIFSQLLISAGLGITNQVINSVRENKQQNQATTVNVNDELKNVNKNIADELAKMPEGTTESNYNNWESDVSEWQESKDLTNLNKQLSDTETELEGHTQTEDQSIIADYNDLSKNPNKSNISEQAFKDACNREELRKEQPKLEAKQKAAEKALEEKKNNCKTAAENLESLIKKRDELLKQKDNEAWTASDGNAITRASKDCLTKEYGTNDGENIATKADLQRACYAFRKTTDPKLKRKYANTAIDMFNSNKWEFAGTSYGTAISGMERWLKENPDNNTTQA